MLTLNMAVNFRELLIVSYILPPTFGDERKRKQPRRVSGDLDRVSGIVLLGDF